MKNNIFKFVMFAFIMATNFSVFAQEQDGIGSTGTGNIGTEGGDGPVAPINSKLIWLAIAGITFAVFYFANKQKQNKIA